MAAVDPIARPDTTQPLLDVADLRVSFPTPDGIVRAVRGVSFAVDGGKTLGVVGESGSGKSVSMQTILGLSLGADATGTARFEGRDLLGLPTGEMRRVRGAEIAMIFQDPLSSLHPHYRVGWQIVEMIRAHRAMPRRQATRRAVELLSMVGIPDARTRVDDYPHQFSGGMRQRVMIAMAMALDPKLLIADEPTTALDVTVQAQILALIGRLQREHGTAVIMITHDLGVIADMADEVMIMYAGKAMERADTRTLYYRPHHPYTNGLLRSLPGQGERKGRLEPIPGLPPSLVDLPSGCPFYPRCGYVMDRCVAEDPPLRAVAGDEHRSACWLPEELVGTGAPVDQARLEAARSHRDGEAPAAETRVGR